MSRLKSLPGRFCSDEGGAFAMIFGVMAIVLVAFSGAVVDFTSMQGARTRAQVALDAAALALQPSIYTESTSDIKSDVQALLLERLGAPGISWSVCGSGAPLPCAEVNSVSVDTTAGQLTLDAQVTVPMNFVRLVGVDSLTAKVESVATRKKLNLEVAMVLDNSGSMATGFGSGTRMSNLQADATCASNILFYGVKDCTTSVTGLTPADNVKFAIVPFNSEVNVGADNATADWLDTTGGAGSFANDNFDDDDNQSTPYTADTNRLDLFREMSYRGTPLSWGGCVEARIDTPSEPFDVDDTPPTTNRSDPDFNPDTLFVPLFAPDEPDTGGYRSGYDNNYLPDDPPSCVKLLGACQIKSAVTVVKTTAVTTTVTTSSGGGWGGRRGGGGGSRTTTSTSTSTSTATSAPSVNAQLTTPGGVVSTGASVCSCGGETILSDTTTSTDPVVGASTTVGPYSSGRNTTTTVVSTPSTTVQTETTMCNAHYHATGLTDRQLQERLCKYNGASLTSAPRLGFGPNGQCPSTPIQPLTDDPALINVAINAMTPAGNTDIHLGAIWGFRVLSPTEPFTQGKPYDAATSKVMIIMTDGENTYDATSNMNGSDLYTPYGYPYNNVNGEGSTSPAKGRLGALGWSGNQFEAEINKRLSETCTNAKAAGITIYTIGLATDDTSDPAGNRALLQGCASEASKAFFPTSAEKLSETFETIANQLADLRLAK